MIESAPDIRYLERSEIDTGKWDHCIIQAANSLIYARSFYLDRMAKTWSALIMNDYEFVMPLTWNRKYGISYLYQPPFAAQLGLFSKKFPDKNILGAFIGHAETYFKFCEIHLNFGNLAIPNPLRTNFVLDLGKPYTELRKGFKKRLLENLQESASNDLQYQVSDDYLNAIRLFKNEYGKRFPHVKNSDYQRFESLCGDMVSRKMIFIREVKNIKGELLDVSVFFIDEGRIYNIMSVTLKEGREKRAHFYLIDRLIAEFSNRHLVLDFEGSEIPGIAEFYRKFGTARQPYPFLKFNHLPYPVKFLK